MKILPQKTGSRRQKHFLQLCQAATLGEWCLCVHRQGRVDLRKWNGCSSRQSWLLGKWCFVYKASCTMCQDLTTWQSWPLGVLQGRADYFMYSNAELTTWCTTRKSWCTGQSWLLVALQGRVDQARVDNLMYYWAELTTWCKAELTRQPPTELAKHHSCGFGPHL